MMKLFCITCLKDYDVIEEHKGERLRTGAACPDVECKDGILIQRDLDIFPIFWALLQKGVQPKMCSPGYFFGESDIEEGYQSLEVTDEGLVDEIFKLDVPEFLQIDSTSTDLLINTQMYRGAPIEHRKFLEIKGAFLQFMWVVVDAIRQYNIEKEKENESK
jgi:hypothetical protein